ncbi:MAG: glycosyltransferase [Acidobacteria bacterium]|nr:glycosyltransferase [Acidobacteriota bacterium]
MQPYRLYYTLKPLIPWSLRHRIKKVRAQRILNTCSDIWPIKESAARVPQGWPGWPEGKQFAFVITHDVESHVGLKCVRQLAELDMSLGFRSSFNFVPEDYEVSLELRSWLTDNGFEVGIHGLHHDGKLYSSFHVFQDHAKRINKYLKEWNCAGFRSPCMHHNLDWICNLDIAYDSSTFDTDPFEPQPDGVDTIFPFWVTSLSGNGAGYVELPYTLPQDYSLFVLLEQETNIVWRTKLNWLAKHGGMALFNMHPDYAAMGQKQSRMGQYDIGLYYDFLMHVRGKYKEQYWHALPKDAASWYRNSVMQSVPSKTYSRQQQAPLKGRRMAVLLYSIYPADPRPKRAAETFVEQGMDVDVICLRENTSDKSKDCIDGVNITRLPIRRRRDCVIAYIIRYATFLIYCAVLLALRYPKRKYEIIHVHNMPDFLVFSAMLPKLFGARIVLDLHDPMPELMRSIFGLPSGHPFVVALMQLEKWSIRFADFVLTPNVSFRNLFISRGCPPEKIQIVMNSPQEDIFNPAVNNNETFDSLNDNHSFRIMYHGLIVERHGLDIAIEAVSRISDIISGIEFHIFGNPTPYMEQMKKLIAQKGLQKRVLFHGHQSQANIAREIANSHLGLIPNRSGPFTEINMPTRIFEYLAIGRPVIVPSTRGIRDYFNDGNMIFFKQESIEDLANKIIWVYKHRDETRMIVLEGQSIYHHHLWKDEKNNLVTIALQLISKPLEDSIV